MSEPTYTINPDGTAITCRRCGLVSYHPMDISTLYCGNCRMFHEASIADDARSADALLTANAQLRAEVAHLRPLYLAAIKANADVALMNATLQVDLIDCQAQLAALESQLGQAHERIAVLEAVKPRKARRKKAPPF